MTEIVVLTVGGTVTGCLWAVCGAAVRIAQVNLGKPKEGPK